MPEAKIAAQGRPANHDFHIDMDAATVTCPAAQTVQISTSKTGFRGAGLPAAVCPPSS